MAASPDSNDDLQFNIVEPTKASVAPQVCIQCQQPIQGTYFAVRNHLLCPNCAQQLGTKPPAFNPIAFVVALIMGLGAGLLGALIWYGVRRIFNAEIGLIAVLVGFLVGKAVRKGSGGRGGVVYQIMAVVLTYVCIAGNYLPDALPSGLHQVPTLREFVIVLWYCLQIPFQGGMQNAIGLLIIGFALWEAWKFTKLYRLPVTGPYQLAPLRPLSPAPPPDMLPDVLPDSSSDPSSPGVII